MPGMGGAAAIRALAERRVPARVLVLTTYDTRQRRGARARGRRDGLPPEGRAARRSWSARSGRRPAARRCWRRRWPRGSSASSGDPAPEALSERELEVLTLIAQGETNRGAAARLFISEATVKTHLLHIYEKLDVNDRAAAVAAAYERGLLVPRRS